MKINKNDKKNVKNKQKNTKKSQKNIDIEKFKQKYFDYYDDIKDYTRGKEDW